MPETAYYAPAGGLSAQSELLTGRAIVTEAYTVIPRSVLSDIVTSNLPGWNATRAWILARPIAGFATTFAQYILEVAPGGGSEKPEEEAGVESVVFVLRGTLSLRIDGHEYSLDPGGYAYIPPGAGWNVKNSGSVSVSFQWIRKAYEPWSGEPPAAFVSREQDVAASPMPDTDGAWSTTRFVEPDDLAHDMHVNIVTLERGATVPFAETHVMEHGLYVLEGKAVFRLNGDWVEVQEGDFMLLRPFCPHALYAGGPGAFRYLLYKNVNRQVKLSRG